MKTLYMLPLMLVLLIIQHGSNAQNIGILSEGNEPEPFEKLYLHTDRDFYFLGDTIWFKAYLLDGQSLSPVSDFQNLYIDLINNKGTITQNQVLLCEYGQASGSMIISDITSTGPFIIRAYTDYLKNFGEEMFFHKALRISKVKSSFEIESENHDIIEEKPEIDVSFFPEGGYLLSGTNNLIAFKSIDMTGKGVSIKGKVLDSKGEIASVFKTHYKGMGRIYLNPMKGESYKVQIDGHPGFSYGFDDIRNEAVKLQLLRHTKNELLLGVVSNSSTYAGQLFFLACFSRDRLLFYKAIVLEGSMLPMKVEVETDLMQGGINKFVLLNGEMEPVSERLVFLDNINVNNLEVKPSHEEVATRSLVQMDIFDDKNALDLEYSTLSVAVVDENALNAGGGAQNILSYLFLDSELRGFIESPAAYFDNDDNITSQDKLNLLMLTNGWSRYLRNSFKENTVNIEYQKTAGFRIKGKAERAIGKKPITDGAITLGIFEDSDINWYESTTDSTGHFSFDDMFFFDSTTIVVQALNERGKQLSKVFIDTLFEKEPAVSSDILSLMKGFSGIPLQHYRQKYYIDLEQREFTPEEGTILLEEVEIKVKKSKPDDGHIRIYPIADQVLEVTDKDYSYFSVLQFLQGRVAGLTISGDEISFRGASSLSRGSTPLFLIDGMPIGGGGEGRVQILNIEDEEGGGGEREGDNNITMSDPTISLIQSIPMSTIDKVEILKGTSAAIFGSRGANGVIAIYTKRGSDLLEREDYITRIITKRMVGFSKYREFYSPQYTTENIDSPMPDHRTTLYWNPNITTENGKAEFSFFTADDLAYYRIIVEGITDNGRICLGSAKFAVNRRNERFTKSLKHSPCIFF